MRNYIILNNQRSDEISGLIIQELAPISKPLQRTQVETIDGRDGDIVTPLGYAAYDKKITIGLYGDFDINEIIAYFATQGTAIFSNEPDKYYNYQILDQIDYERLVRFRVATVTMHVQPFKYSATEGTLTIDASDTVSGEGSEIALDNTAEAPFTTLRHKGNATQTTYSGKNLINGANLPSQAYSGSLTNSYYNQFDLGVEVEAGVTYTFSFVMKSFSGANYYNMSLGIGATYYARDITNQNNITTIGGRVTQTFTPTEAQITGAGGAKLYARVPRFGTQTSFSWTMDEFQLEKSSSFTSYEPYVGGTASPNPDYPQDISLLTGDSTITIDDGGDNSQEYVIPFGDTYLAAIGNYVDEPVKVGDTWYIRRAVGKVVLTGSANETWTMYGSSGQRKWYLAQSYFGDNLPFTNHVDKCDHFIVSQYISESWVPNRFGWHTTAKCMIFDTDFGESLSDWTSWLATHPTTVYYALVTPTDEEITDQDLIDALDEFYGQAHSYKGHTHITATTEDGNAPAVLAVEVGEDNESTVTNAGNTTSRPILTIYGQGDIGVYINDVEVLDIALGNEQYITLDSTEMDAYKDSPANLKNRLVTGDYSKLALNAGANKIRFTGNVTKYEISKYSRWL